MLNIVHIGYGYWGTNVVRNLMASDKTNLIAVCDAAPARLSAAKKLYPEIETAEDYSVYLDDPRVDAFSLAIQTEPSYAIAMEILSKGKHLFIEKPIATTAERAEKLTQTALDHDLILHCDHIMIYHPIIQSIKTMYDSGELGELLYFDVSRMNLGPIRMDVNAMLDLAVHDLAIIDYLTNGKEPIQVEAIGLACFGQQEALTYLTMKYEGFVAHLKSSWISPIKERRIMIGFSKKMIVFDDLNLFEKLKIYNYGFVETHEQYGAYEFKTRTGDILSPNIPQQDALRNSIEHFASCVETGKQSLSSGVQGVKVARVLDRAKSDLKKQEKSCLS